jgi:hypothetical protein
MSYESIMYCPICGKNITACNIEEVENGLHDGYIFIHDDIDHSDSDLEAMDSGIN